MATAWGVTPAIQKFRLWWQLRIQNSFICIFRLLSTRPFDFQTSFLDFTRRPKNKVNILKNKLKTYRNLLNLDKKFPSPIELSVIFFIAQSLRYRYPQCTFRQNSANDPFKWTLQIFTQSHAVSWQREEILMTPRARAKLFDGL